jgi:formylglycine-generating enzyme required for sulfatase activity
LAPHNDLLFHSGGPQWRAIEEDVSTARNLARRPGKGAAYYRSALSALPAAVAEAEAFKRQAKLADALGVARLTKAAGQWQACLASVGEALALDPSHAEALALKRAAESVQLAAEERDRLEKIASALAAARQAQASGDFSTCATRAGEALALEAGNAEAAALKRAAEGNLARKDPAEGQGWTSRAAGMEFVWVPALKIWVGKYEVTNGEYRKKEPRHYSERYEGQSLNSDRQPVVYVNFEEAKAYATWLTQREQSLLGGLRYRVISETEWQTAAQCGDGRDYPWGAGMPPKYGNYADTSAKRVFSGWTAIDRYDDGYAVTCPVEQSGKNDWGLYGMGGNVWECCAADTSGGAFGAWRGASWYNNDPGNLRCASHLDLSGSRRGLSYGFRLVLSR